MLQDETLLHIARTLIQRYNSACRNKPHERWELPAYTESASVAVYRGAWDRMELRGVSPSGVVMDYTFDYVRSGVESQPFVMNRQPV